MSKKKNIPASNSNLINSQDGFMNSMNTNNPSSDTDVKQKMDSAKQPGIWDTKQKR